MWLDLITAVYCAFIAWADFHIVTKPEARQLGLYPLIGAVIFIFGRRVLALLGKNYDGYWWGGGYGDWKKVEPRDWPPFMYAFAGYVCLLFATFPLIDALVTGGVNP